MQPNANGQRFCTDSGIPLKAVYTKEDVADGDPDLTLGLPGSAPFTRGVYPNMYRDRPWRIFQLSGTGTPEDEGARIKYLLSKGETGFIMESDISTWDMLDIDYPDVVARPDEVGMYGPPLMSLRDYEIALDGIPIEQLYAHPGGVVPMQGPYGAACYFALAENRGIPIRKLSGTGESDFFLGYLSAVRTKPVPPAAGLRLSCDLVEFCLANVPKFIPVSISTYNARENGLPAWEELALSLANAIAYFDEIIARGRFKIDDFAHTIGGFGLASDRDFFEEIAKLRAGRRMWYRLLHDRYGARNERALKMRVHVVTNGSNYTHQQPLNNIVRGTCQALAAVLAGVQSMGISAYDEAICTPSEAAHAISLNTHHILQTEINVTNVVDPLGGSYFVEWLTNEVERRAWDYLQQIEEHSGFIKALDSGWLHRESMRGMIERDQRTNNGQRHTVGVNCFVADHEPHKVEVFRHNPSTFQIQMARLQQLREERDNERVGSTLAALRQACDSGENVMLPLIAAIKAYATIGEIGQILRDAFGVWKVPVPI